MTDEEETENKGPKAPIYRNAAHVSLRTGSTLGGGGGGGGADIFHRGCGGGTRAPISAIPMFDFENSDDFNTSFMWQWFEHQLNGGVSGGKMWWGLGMDFMCALWDPVNNPQVLSSGLIFPVLGYDTLSNGGIVHDEWNFMRASAMVPFGGVDCHFMVREFSPGVAGQEAEDPYQLMDVLIGFHKIPFYGPFGIGAGNDGVYFAKLTGVASPSNWQAMVYVFGQVPFLVDTGIPFETQVAHKFHVLWQLEDAYFYIDDLLVAHISVTDTGEAGWPFDTILYAGIGFMNLNEDDTVFYPQICQPFAHAIGKTVRYRTVPP